MLHRPLNLLSRNHRWRRNQQMVSRDSVHASLHRIDQQSAAQAGLADQSGKISLRRKWRLALLVTDEFHPPQQTQTTNIAHHVKIPQTLKATLQTRPPRPQNISIPSAAYFHP